MKIRMDHRIVTALIASVSFLPACERALEVVNDIPPPSDAPDDDGSLPPSGGGPCACGHSDALMPLSCDSRSVPLLDNDIVQTTPDGGIVAFNLCDEDLFNCVVMYWDGSARAQLIGTGFLLGLNDAGSRLLTTSPLGVALVQIPDGPTEPIVTMGMPLQMIVGRGMLSAAGDIITAVEWAGDAAYLVRRDVDTGELERLAQVDGGLARAYVNPDASSIVGYGVDVDGSGDWSYRWNEQGFSFGLPNAPPSDRLWPEALSADGSTVAGRAREEGLYFLWSDSEGYREVAPSSGHSETLLSADGSVLAGSLDPEGPSDTSVFRWTRDTGVQDLTPGIRTFAIDMSDAGHVVVASSWEDAQIEGAHPQGTFVWDETHGTRSLAEILQARGADTRGWEFGRARALSGDGKVLLGRGVCGGTPTLYRVVLSD